jgi:putative endonuclease
MKTEKRIIGDFGEDAAVKYLKRKHYKILDRNTTLGKLELDIVAKTRTDIVFIEVKTRSVGSLDGDMAYGRPSDAVNLEKRRNTVNAAYAYLKEKPSKLNMRIDVIEVYLDKSAEKPTVLKIEHFENAVTRKNI